MSRRQNRKTRNIHTSRKRGSAREPVAREPLAREPSDREPSGRNAAGGIRWAIPAALALLVAAAAVHFFLGITRDPNVVLLTEAGPARWITYPHDPGVSVRDGFYAHLTARFTRRFAAEGRSPVALSVRAFERCSVLVNARPVPETAGEDDWRRARRVDLTAALAPGENTLEIIVASDYGPPCLWAHAQGLDEPLATDSTWAVAIDGLPGAPAVVADDTKLTGLNRQGVAPWAALVQRLPVLATVFVVVLLAALLWQAQAARAPRALPDPRPGLALVAALAGWVVLFANNGARLGFWTGFDMPGHLAYVEYLLDHHALPPAREGWESHQPPLFYLLSAAVLGAARTLATEAQALWSLKIIPFLSGAGQIVLAWLAATRLFERRPAAIAAATAFAAIVPMNLYVASYVTNEPLAGFTAGLVTLAALALVAAERARTRDFLLLGAAMGMAVATKVTGWVPVLVAAAVVLSSLAAARARRASHIAGAVAAMAVAGLALGASFYARNWIAYGTLVVSPWRGGIEYAWWQDPGFHTPAYFLQFGRVFTWPAFSAFYSFWDSAYATFWGDWLCGGMGGYEARPPWNYAYMAALVPLGLPVATLLAIGFAVASVKAIRGDRARLLAIGTVAALAYSLIELNLRVPYHGHAKAFFCLGGLLSAALLFAEGLEWVLERLGAGLRAAALAVFWGYMGAAAIAVGAAFFVRADDPQLHLHEAWRLTREEKLEEAVPLFERTLAAVPDHGVAHGELAHTLALLGRMPDAARHFEAAARLRPRDAETAVRYATVLGELGRNDEAMAQLGRALAVDPANVRANLLQAEHLAVRGRTAEAAEQCRRVLRIEPGNPDARRLLEALERRG